MIGDAMQKPLRATRPPSAAADIQDLRDGMERMLVQNYDLGITSVAVLHEMDRVPLKAVYRSTVGVASTAQLNLALVILL